jgi:hypothetical protein
MKVLTKTKNRFVKEFDQSGFIDGLYKNKTLGFRAD